MPEQIEYFSLIYSNKFPVILRDLDVESAVIRRFGVGEWLNFAVDSLLIPENWYSGIGFWVIKYRPTRYKQKYRSQCGISIYFGRTWIQTVN